MSTKAKAVTFVSRYLRLKLVRESSYNKEINGKILPTKGKYIQFESGAFTTSDAEEIEYLENHTNFGDVFIKVDKDAAAERAEYVQTLEERVAELEAEKAESEGDDKKVTRKAPAKKAAKKAAKKTTAKY